MPPTGNGGSELVEDASTFFASHTPYHIRNGGGISTGLTPDQRFSIPETPGGNGAGVGEFSVTAWPDMTGGQPPMTPVAEGVLRSIMAMGPMETMDLGWDTAA